MDKLTSSKWHFLLVLAVLLLACNSTSPSDSDDTSAPPSNDTGGSITYTYAGRVFRIAAQEGAAAQDISLALDSLSSGGGDDLLNISPDGDWLVFTLGGPQSDLYGLQPDTDSEPVALVADDQINESWPAISPDGRWLAYVSAETGAEQVYVRPFPNVTDAKWLVSTNGGTQPKWARRGQGLCYKSGGNPEMVAVDILPGSTFTTGEHRVLFGWGNLDNDRWDVAPGDQRFVFVRFRRYEEGTTRLILVQNFFEELRQRVGN